MKNVAYKSLSLFFAFATWFLYSISPWLMLISLFIAWGFWRTPKLFPSENLDVKNKRVGFVLLLVLLAMTMFSYLMVPLFHQMCHVLDIGGKVHSYQGNATNINSKKSNIEYYPVITLYANAPIAIDLSPKSNFLPMSGGFQNVFVLTNKLNKAIKIRLKITIAPSSATNYIQEVTKFNNQVLSFKPKEKRSLIVKYNVSQLPKNTEPSVAMAYTFFKTK
jgi:cytochrome c oxidase assembly protein Cox11